MGATFMAERDGAQISEATGLCPIVEAYWLQPQCPCACAQDVVTLSTGFYWFLLVSPGFYWFSVGFLLVFYWGFCLLFVSTCDIF
jgi:hypothetical protein